MRDADAGVPRLLRARDDELTAEHRSLYASPEQGVAEPTNLANFIYELEVDKATHDAGYGVIGQAVPYLK